MLVKLTCPTTISAGVLSTVGIELKIVIRRLFFSETKNLFEDESKKASTGLLSVFWVVPPPPPRLTFDEALLVVGMVLKMRTRWLNASAINKCVPSVLIHRGLKRVFL